MSAVRGSSESLRSIYFSEFYSPYGRYPEAWRRSPTVAADQLSAGSQWFSQPRLPSMHVIRNSENDKFTVSSFARPASSLSSATATPQQNFHGMTAPPTRGAFNYSMPVRTLSSHANSQLSKPDPRTTVNFNRGPGVPAYYATIRNREGASSYSGLGGEAPATERLQLSKTMPFTRTSSPQRIVYN
jgi:hypothetical protein